jgi:ribosome-associated protein
MIRINSRLSIPDSEPIFTFSRSSGPGGQNVNKLNTRATLLFDVAHSPSLSEKQKTRIIEKLSTRINKEGVLRVVSQKHRTQNANREAAVERFASLLRSALRTSRPRRKTSVPEAVKRKRLDDKRRRGRLKSERRRPDESG